MRDWRDEIKAGDILLSKNGVERVVRAVTHRGETLHSVTFAILRRSWTDRAYTVIFRSELKERGFTPTGKKYRFKAGTVDTDLMHDLRYENRFMENQRLRADSVINKGVR